MYTAKDHVRTAALLLPILAMTASGASLPKGGFSFVNVADTTQGFTSFGSMPSINNAGAVAFKATGAGFLTTGVFEWDNNNRVTTIATSADGVLRFFSDGVITPGGAVEFIATLANVGGDAVLATGTGGNVSTLLDARQQGLLGRTLTSGGTNREGTATATAFRLDIGSEVILSVTDHGALTPLIDTKSSNFAFLGNAAINASGRIAFEGFFADGTEGIYTGPNGSTVIADTNGIFAGFLDPVMNNGGMVGSAGFLKSGGAEVFTSNGKGITARTDPASSLFSFFDNVTINEAGHVAFSGFESTGGQGIFLETSGGASPVAVIHSGDTLFGSTVTAIANGLFALNDRDQVVFQYLLADGRSGVAIANPAR